MYRTVLYYYKPTLLKNNWLSPSVSLGLELSARQRSQSYATLDLCNVLFETLFLSGQLLVNE
jgi:hypothetical protein